MKPNLQIFFVLFVLSINSNVNAQSRLDENMKIIRSKILSSERGQAPQPSRKGTAVNERMTGRAVTSPTWLYPEDTSAFYYKSQERGMTAEGDHLQDYLDDGYPTETNVNNATIRYDSAYSHKVGLPNFWYNYRQYNNEGHMVYSTKGSEIFRLQYIAPGQCSLVNYYVGPRLISTLSREMQNGNCASDSEYAYTAQLPTVSSIYSYTVNNQLSSRTFFLWDSSNNAWENMGRALFVHDAGGRTVRRDYQYLHANTWHIFSIDSFIYPRATGSYEQYKDYLYDTASTAYSLRSMYRCHLNSAELIDTLYHESFINREFPDSKTVITYTAYNHIRTYRRYEQLSDGTYSPNPIYNARFYYELHYPTSVPAVSAPSWQVYPNPVKEAIIVSGNTNDQAHIELVNTVGRTVLEAAISIENGPQLINVSHLSPGLYFYRITQDGIVWMKGNLLKD